MAGWVEVGSSILGRGERRIPFGCSDTQRKVTPAITITIIFLLKGSDEYCNIPSDPFLFGVIMFLTRALCKSKNSKHFNQIVYVDKSSRRIYPMGDNDWCYSVYDINGKYIGRFRLNNLDFELKENGQKQQKEKPPMDIKIKDIINAFATKPVFRVVLIEDECLVDSAAVTYPQALKIAEDYASDGVEVEIVMAVAETKMTVELNEL